jgi:hypothetical protein
MKWWFVFGFNKGEGGGLLLGMYPTDEQKDARLEELRNTIRCNDVFFASSRDIPPEGANLRISTDGG